MEVLIVGAGSMGTWFGRTIDAEIAFADVDTENAVAAAEATGGSVADLEGSDRYDAVCIAVPMGYVTDAIEEQAPRARKAILDVSGVMGTPLDAMATHTPDRERASLHPLFAPERAPGSIPLVVGNGGPTIDRLVRDLEAGGNDVFETTAAEHDEAMETVQAATHAAALAFAIASDPAPEAFGTPVYDELEGLTRTMLGGTPRVYADIQETFDGADAIAEAAARVAGADHEEFSALYEEASQRWVAESGTGGTETAADADATRTTSTGRDTIEDNRESTDTGRRSNGGAVE